MNFQGATAAIKAFREATRGNVVDTQEVTRRAAICGACPKRTFVRGARSEVSQVLGVLANKHRVPPELSGCMCGVCKCSLMLLIPATPADLHKDTPEELAERPEQCWIKQIK